MTRAANPAVGVPRSTAVTNGVPEVTNAVDPRSLPNPAVADPSRRLNNAAANPRAPLAGAHDPGLPQNTGTNPRGINSRGSQPTAIDAQGRPSPGRLNAANNPRARLNPGDPRNRFVSANNPRGRLIPSGPRGAQRAFNDPRTRLQGLDIRSRVTEAHDFRRTLLEHRRMNFLARTQLPVRPYFGQRGFTGVPPVGETRYVTNEMVFHVGSDVPRARVEAAMRRHGMTLAATESMSLTGGTMFHVRVAGGKPLTDVVRDLEAEQIGLAQPNYVFHLMRDASTPGSEPVATVSGEADAQALAPAAAEPPQDTTLAARPAAKGDPGQYVVNKLKLGDAHRVATGNNVLVAVIDSKIDAKHPDLAGSIVEQYDATGRNNKPDTHGTGMAGAIAAQRKLLGVAPGAKILAINAFSSDGSDSPQATSKHILAGLEYAIKRGARVIIMSFAGPYDPVLQLAMKKARE
ncbi:MAG: S8 family serine peptidase, partial [Xanthobacteraceae bacterium]